jgi:hypothetical protein
MIKRVLGIDGRARIAPVLKVFAYAVPAGYSCPFCRHCACHFARNPARSTASPLR